VPTIRPVAPRVAPVVAPVATPVPAAPAAARGTGVQLTPEQLVELERVTTTMNALDYFELLRLEKSADPGAIKRAFYAQSRTWHPDRFFHLPNPMLKERVHELYKRLTEAYAVLRDDGKRLKYLADVTGPERAQKLRFTESSEVEARAQKKKEQEEQIGTTPKGRQFFQTGAADLDAGRLAAAERNLKMALTFEPSNALFKAKLKEAQDKLLEEARKSGSQFKIK
jgi:curved DNA-binding protein CbpA